MSEHWEPRVKRRSQESLLESQGGDAETSGGDHVGQVDGDDTGDTPEAHCMQDDYGEACLAESLGVVLMAHEVLPDTQAPDDTQVEDNTMESLAPQGLVLEHPEPLELFNTNTDSQITPTELDEPTPCKSVVEILDSPPPVVTSSMTSTGGTDVMSPSSKKQYSQDDLDSVRAKIELMK